MLSSQIPASALRFSWRVTSKSFRLCSDPSPWYPFSPLEISEPCTQNQVLDQWRAVSCSLSRIATQMLTYSGWLYRKHTSRQPYSAPRMVSRCCYYSRKRNLISKPPTPNVIFLDLNRPGVNGWDVLRAMQQTEALRPIPVLVFATHCGDKQQVLAWGARAYIDKPFEFDQFLAEVQAAYRAVCSSNDAEGNA